MNSLTQTQHGIGVCGGSGGGGSGGSVVGGGGVCHGWFVVWRCSWLAYQTFFFLSLSPYPVTFLSKLACPQKSLMCICLISALVKVVICAYNTRAAFFYSLFSRAKNIVSFYRLGNEQVRD